VSENVAIHRRTSKPTWVGLHAAARRLRLPVHSVLSAIRCGTLPARLVAGSRWFIDAKDLEGYRRRIDDSYKRRGGT
jgi:hypothetical protein